MNLDIKKAQALLAIIETGSFEQAAQQLCVTSSAISQRIKALENQLGVPLVTRTHPCRATHEGTKLVYYLRRSNLLEQEFEASFCQDQKIRVTIAVNNDSLATWLLPTLSDFLNSNNILLDITVDDQDFTHKILESGLVLGAVSSNETAMRGCIAERLGSLRYRLLASPHFYARWFPSGSTRQALIQAPLLVFDRKDMLQANFLRLHFGVHQEQCACHFIPSSDAFFLALKMGMGYGMIPELHCKEALINHEVVDLAPGKYTDISLFWHRWEMQSRTMSQLTECLLENSKQWLDA